MKNDVIQWQNTIRWKAITRQKGLLKNELVTVDLLTKWMILDEEGVEKNMVKQYIGQY